MVKHFFSVCLVFLSSILLQAQTPTAFWGLQTAGGQGRMGLIFRTDPSGNNYTVTHNFQTASPGNVPRGGILKDAGGIFYGTQASGGLFNYGLIYSYDPATALYTDVLDFKGFSPGGTLIKTASGKYYGISNLFDPTVYLYEADLATKTATIKYTFSLGDGPGNMIAGPGGKLYGISNSGGVAGFGYVFSYDPATNTYAVEKEFDSSITYPQGTLLLASNGFMYGATAGGGANNLGGLFRFDPVGKSISLLTSFSTTTGWQPGQQLIQVTSDLLVGVVARGTQGSVYDYSIGSGILTPRYSLASGVDPNPDVNLLLGSDGLIYGTGGSEVAGSSARLFRYNPVTYAYTVEHEFLNTGINTPVGQLVESADHKLYSPCLFGGPTALGGIFRFDLTNSQFNTAIAFQLSPGGATPRGTLLQASSGQIFGTTSGGGSFDSGIIFELNQQTGGINILKHVDPAVGIPDGGLIEYGNKFYGVATLGGAAKLGTIFSFDPQTNVIEVLAEFTGTTGLVRGDSPSRSLLLLNNKFYGLTRFGGDVVPNSTTTSVLYEFDPLTKQYASKHIFTASTGASARGQLMAASNGKIYGLCGTGGTNNKGVLFEYDPSNGNYSVQFNFSTTTGYGAFGGLVEGRPGHLFASLPNGGSFGGGTIFDFDLVSKVGVVRHNFTSTEGTAILGGLMLAKNGKLYGMASLGGTMGVGTWFEFDPVTFALVKKLDMDGTNGARPANSISLEAVTTNQTITFGPLPAKTVGDAPFSLNASSTSNLPVVYTSSNLAVATISGNTVTITGGGTTTISATQPGNTFYNAATPVPQQLVVSKLPQTITFAALTNKVFGDPAFALTGNSSSNLEVGFSSSDPSVATIAGSTVTITGAGIAVITASQSGDNFYVAAAPVVQTLVVNKANQVIAFSALPDKKAGDAPFALTGTSTSGLTISYASSNTAVATISGQTVTVVGAGSTQITASQSGNTNYNAATSVVQTLNVTAVTGLEGANDSFLVYPNPVEDMLQLRLPRPGTVQQIEVHTMEGRALETRSSDQSTETISFSAYTPGMYVITITTSEGVYRSKVARR